MSNPNYINGHRYQIRKDHPFHPERVGVCQFTHNNVIVLQDEKDPRCLFAVSVGDIIQKDCPFKRKGQLMKEDFYKLKKGDFLVLNYRQSKEVVQFSRVVNDCLFTVFYIFNNSIQKREHFFTDYCAAPYNKDLKNQEWNTDNWVEVLKH